MKQAPPYKKATMRRSARIASLYGTEWSNLPSVRQVKNAKRAIQPEKDPSQKRDCDFLIQLLRNYDENAPLLQRSKIILFMFEYLAVRPSILSYHAGIKETVMKKIQEFTHTIAHHEAELEEYRTAVAHMKMALYDPFQEKGMEILTAGMKSLEEQAAIWSRLKYTMDFLGKSPQKCAF